MLNLNSVVAVDVALCNSSLIMKVVRLWFEKESELNARICSVTLPHVKLSKWHRTAVRLHR